MLNKRFKFLLIGGVVLTAAILSVSVIKITDKVFAASQGGAQSLKIFVQSQEKLESAANNWFVAQENITVDGFSLVDYNGGDYLVVVSYHASDTGSLPTRLKVIGGEDPESNAQSFLSSLDPSQTARFISAVPGYHSRPDTTITVPIIFIVYE